MKKRTIPLVFALAASTALAGCLQQPELGSAGTKPSYSYGVTRNDTPYSLCLASFGPIQAKRLPTFAVGEISDKTGQINYDDNGHALSQGASEMVISALYKTGKVKLVERLDLRIPLAEIKLSEQKRLSRTSEQYGKLPASDFIVVGAITELNYNITSGGAQVFIQGVGGGARTVTVNVAMDLRVVDTKTFDIRYVTSLQKQIVGHEVEADVFRFFGTTLVEVGAGKIQNEPLQLGVRSIAEVSVYQIMTKFLGLPTAPSCALVKNDHMTSRMMEYREQIEAGREVPHS